MLADMPPPLEAYTLPDHDATSDDASESESLDAGSSHKKESQQDDDETPDTTISSIPPAPRVRVFNHIYPLY